jgi:hypothetical protein
MADPAQTSCLTPASMCCPQLKILTAWSSTDPVAVDFIVKAWKGAAAPAADSTTGLPTVPVRLHLPLSLQSPLPTLPQVVAPHISCCTSCCLTPCSSAAQQ